MLALDKAVAELRRAESELRTIAGSAVVQGDYAGVTQIVTWAQSLASIISSVDSLDNAESDLGGVSSDSKIGETRRQRPVVKSDYPRFFRDGTAVIKIGWSKKERREYEHRLPGPAFESIVDRIAVIGAAGKAFSTDELFAVHDAEGQSVPSYQVYAGLSLLQSAGLLDRHGRGGYSVIDSQNFRTIALGHWRNLPRKLRNSTK
jgi:hypothetical protein